MTLKVLESLCRVRRSALAVGLMLAAPAASLAQDAAPAEAGDTWAFEHPQDTFKSDALLDLRWLNEKEAGQSGFVKLSDDGNSFVTGDGRPLKFWAVGSDIYRKTPAEMADHARFLAKVGVNMVRLHTQLAPAAADAPVTDVNQAEIDGIWHMVAALKKEGIYVTISPYWANGKQAGKWGIEGYAGQTDLWGVLFFNETLQKGYKAWVKALYTPKNPYTGIPLAKDASVALIQVQNEDGMFFWTIGGLHPEQRQLLGKKFGQWLVKKYASLDKAKAAWEGAAVEGDDFAQGVAGIDLQVWRWGGPQPGGAGKRLSDQMEFIAQTQRQFYTDITTYYRKELGCKQLMNSSNWITANPIHLNDLERWTDTADEVIAVNKYFGGVHIGEANGWRVDPGHYFTSKPGVLNPRDLPTNLKQPAGHPMVITESTWVSPEGYQNEGPLMMAVYQAVTGVDTFYWFAATATEYEMHPHLDFLNFNGQHPMFKWSCSIPAITGNFPAAALMYRKGYLKTGKPVVHEERALADLWQRQTPRIAEDASFDPNRNTGNTGSQSNPEKGIDPLAFLVGPVDVKYGGDPAKTTTIDLSKFIDHAGKRITSETREVSLDYGNGICTFDTPKAQGVTGFVSKAGEIKLGAITLKSGNEHASIAVVAMDDKPLAQSAKVLVQVGTPVRPTGWKQEPADFTGDDKVVFHGYKIVSTGAMPWRVPNTDVTLAVKNPHLKKATLLNTSGYAAGPVQAESKAGTFTLKLPNNAMYVILE